MLLISRSVDLRKTTCISSLCSTDKLSFLPFSIFGFLLQVPISSSVSQMMKELHSSSMNNRSSYSFWFLHVPFNSMMKKYLEVCAIKLPFLRRILFINILFFPRRSSTAFPNKLVSLITLPSPFSSRTIFRNSQNTSTPIMLMSSSLSHKIQYSKFNTWLISMLSLLVKNDISLLNASMAIRILIFVSLVQQAFLINHNFTTF